MNPSPPSSTTRSSANRWLASPLTSGPTGRPKPRSSSNEGSVLSRIAESLYWLGRYTERAEATARILDVYSHALLEDRVGGEESACRRLVEVMGATEPAAVVEVGTNVESLVGFFVDDPRFDGS